MQVQVNQAAPVHPGAGEKSWKVDASKFQLKQVQVQAPPPASPMAGSKHPGLLPEKLPEKPKPQQVLEDKSKVQLFFDLFSLALRTKEPCLHLVDMSSDQLDMLGIRDRISKVHV